MHPEIAALCAAHHLSSAAAVDIAALVARLTSGPRLDGVDAASGAVESPGGGLPSRFTDVGLLGVGGMGEVRRVQDRELGRTCAFKAIRVDQATKPSVVA